MKSFITVVLVKGDHTASVPYEWEGELDQKVAAATEAVRQFLIDYVRGDDGEHASETVDRILSGIARTEEDFWSMEGDWDEKGVSHTFQGEISDDVFTLREKYACHK